MDQPRAITAEEYSKLSPREQGFVWYMQAEWNKLIPKKCPYGIHTYAYGEWAAGQQDAVLVVQDFDD